MGVASPPAEGAVDERSLIFGDFLAMPLLDLGDDTDEQKFLGNEEIAHNIDSLGHMVDAYVHHALIDGLGDILFVDVQGGFLSMHLTIKLPLISLAIIGVVLKDGGLCLFGPQSHTFVFH